MKQLQIHDTFYNSLLKSDSIIIKSKTFDCKFIITYKTRFISKDNYLRCLCTISILSNNLKFEYNSNKYNDIVKSGIKLAIGISDKVINKYYTNYKRISKYEIKCKDDKHLYLTIKYQCNN